MEEWRGWGSDKAVSRCSSVGFSFCLQALAWTFPMMTVTGKPDKPSLLDPEDRLTVSARFLSFPM